MLKLFSDTDRVARAELRNAYSALDNLECAGFESEEYLDANQRVAEAERALPWWKRLDIMLAR